MVRKDNPRVFHHEKGVFCDSFFIHIFFTFEQIPFGSFLVPYRNDFELINHIPIEDLLRCQRKRLVLIICEPEI